MRRSAIGATRKGSVVEYVIFFCFFVHSERPSREVDDSGPEHIGPVVSRCGCHPLQTRPHTDGGLGVAVLVRIARFSLATEAEIFLLGRLVSYGGSWFISSIPATLLL